VSTTVTCTSSRPYWYSKKNDKQTAFRVKNKSSTFTSICEYLLLWWTISGPSNLLHLSAFIGDTLLRDKLYIFKRWCGTSGCPGLFEDQQLCAERIIWSSLRGWSGEVGGEERWRHRGVRGEWKRPLVQRSVGIAAMRDEDVLCMFAIGLCNL